jgi:uncharacterized SAM-binding protein YcdF (DUF218 family)
MVPAGAIIFVAAYFGFTLIQVWMTGREQPRQIADAIVVLGAAQYDGRPSQQLAARLDEVLRRWDEGLAPMVVVTGGRQPGDRFTEAEASARYLADRGVPEEAILLENEGSSTYESLEAVAQLLPPGTEVILVSDPFHSLRSKLIARQVGLSAAVAPTRTSVVGGWRDLGLHLREMFGVGIGRVIGFDRLDRLTG